MVVDFKGCNHHFVDNIKPYTSIPGESSSVVPPLLTNFQKVTIKVNINVSLDTQTHSHVF